MRIAVLSDIHGFSIAFQRVLDDIDEQGPFDAIVIAGDLCETGPAPRQVLEMIWERDLPAVHGNTDLYLVEEARDGTHKRERLFTIAEIGQDGLNYLASLPFSLRISPPDARGSQDDLLVVHANPGNVHDALEPQLSDEEIRQIIGEVQAGAIAFGHLHISYTRIVDSTLLVDVAAVGNPKDGELMSKYAIFTWSESERRWRAAIQKVPYPLAETEAQIRASGLPKPEKTIRKLRETSYTA